MIRNRFEQISLHDVHSRDFDYDEKNNGILGISLRGMRIFGRKQPLPISQNELQDSSETK